MCERDQDFAFPEPTDKTRGKELTLWATHYYIHQAQAAVDGYPLLDVAGNSLGVSLSLTDWCLGAVEGTVRVTQEDRPPQTFNYAKRAETAQVDCSAIVPNLPEESRKDLGRTRFEVTQGPFGTGYKAGDSPPLLLVPFRTIAVDPKVIPIHSVVYIPDARGTVITLPNGKRLEHDGYFYAADTGSAIECHHIDVFGGIERSNPFPSFIKSQPEGKFTAFIVHDEEITKKLSQAHLP